MTHLTRQQANSYQMHGSRYSPQTPMEENISVRGELNESEVKQRKRKKALQKEKKERAWYLALVTSGVTTSPQPL